MGFQDVMGIAELPPGTSRRVEVAGRRLALWHTRDGILATDDTCSHEQASLSDGDFEPDEAQVACPKHGARFDLRSGRALTLPAHRPVRTYPVTVTGGRVLVAVEPSEEPGDR